MQITTKLLLTELKALTKRHASIAESFSELPLEALNYRTAEKSWSVLECLEHLNLYGDYYLPAIAESMEESDLPPDDMFNSGLLGNYFANSMMPRAKLNKMNTFKDKNPLGSKLNKDAIFRFQNQQNELLELLDKAAHANLNRIKIPITISRFIRLKLGDTFRFTIYHNERHIQQAQRVLADYNAGVK